MDNSWTIRATQVALPAIEDEHDLREVTSLEGDQSGRLEYFHFTGGDWRSVELADRQFTAGRISGLKVAKARFTGVNLTSIEVDRCDLSSAEWREGKLNRVRFTLCKFLGASFTDVSMEDVVFTQCKLDLATFESLRAKGAVAFSNCTLNEAAFTACNLTGAAFEDCSLREVAFEGGTYKNCDLRGNDLSAIRGVTELRRAIIEPAQTLQLGRALVADLELRIPGQD